jgi:esterase/lipase superfamily enzyme
MISRTARCAMSEDTIFIDFQDVPFAEAEKYAVQLANYLKDLPSADVAVWTEVRIPGTSGPTVTIRLGTNPAVIAIANMTAAWLRTNPSVRIKIVAGHRSTVLSYLGAVKTAPIIEQFLSGRSEVRMVQLLEAAQALRAPPPPTYAVIRLFYATDRKSTGQILPAAVYGKDRNSDGNLSLGICEVSIPHDHRMGALEHPSIWRLELGKNPEKHVVLMAVTPRDSGEFWSDVSSSVGNSRKKEAFVFVHGYDTTFEDAARRTAQIAYDLGFDGAPICYSWPSCGDLADYPKDETNAQWTVPHLKRFLQQVAENSGATTIHIIAHSMGNRAVSHALQLLSSEEQTKPCRMRHVVLTAPDIDADTFKELADAIKSVSDRVTLYISPLDKALALSKRFHGYPRLGEAISVIPGIDTIDASSVDTSFIGHSYYAENRSVLSDIFWLLKDGKPPMERFGMQIVQDGSNVYYAFRP